MYKIITMFILFIFYSVSLGWTSAESDSASVSLEAWPIKIDDQFVNSSPVIADLDNDGFAEVIAAGSQRVYVWDKDGKVKDGWPQETYKYDFNVNSGTVCVSDIDNDGFMEIIVATPRIYVWDYKGSIKHGWPQDISGIVNYGTTVTVADIDNDGKKEIIYPISLASANGANPGIIYVFNYDGKIKKGWPQVILPTKEESQWLSTAVVGDVDKNGYPDIVLATVTGEVFVYRNNGISLENWPKQALQGDRFYVSPTLADLDKDGYLEILVGACNGNQASSFYVFDKSGKFYNGFPVNVDSNIQSKPAAADLDNDGKLEIVFGTNKGNKLYVLKSNATNFPGWPKELTKWVCNDPVIGDIDNDGKPEIVVCTSDAKLHAFRIDGKELDGWPKIVDKKDIILKSASIYYLDKNRTVGVAFASDQQIFLWVKY